MMQHDAMFISQRYLNVAIGATAILVVAVVAYRMDFVEGRVWEAFQAQLGWPGVFLVALTAVLAWALKQVWDPVTRNRPGTRAALAIVEGAGPVFGIIGTMIGLKTAAASDDNTLQGIAQLANTTIVGLGLSVTAFITDVWVHHLGGADSPSEWDDPNNQSGQA